MRPADEDTFIEGAAGRLAVRWKSPAVPPAQVVILVQGSNLSGQSMFDFQFPGGEDYSLMDALTAAGFAVVTFAIRGYGASQAPADPFKVTTEAAMEDLARVVDWVTARGWVRPHLLGFSWGGRIAGRYAESHADRIGRLVLYDPARGGGNLVLPAPAADHGWWINTHEHYSEKLEPAFTAADLRKALGEHVERFESRSPNGIRLENATPVISIDPTRVTSPTLLIYGVEAAKANYMQGGMERAEFFERLATDDKAFVIIPGGGDFAHFQQARFRLVRAVADFLRPH